MVKMSGRMNSFKINERKNTPNQSAAAQEKNSGIQRILPLYFERQEKHEKEAKDRSNRPQLIFSRLNPSKDVDLS